LAAFDSFARVFSAWGRWLHRWRWGVVAGWLVVLLFAAAGAGKLEQAMQGGTGHIVGSESAAAERMLRDDFANPFAQMLVLVVSSDTQTLDSPGYARFLRDVAAHLRTLPAVTRVATYDDTRDARLVSADRRRAIVLIGVRAGDVGEVERAVPVLREAVEPFGATARQADPTLQWHVTGRGALTHDINRFSTEDSGRAEARSFPLTAAVLLLAFGSLVAAALPLGVGVSAILLTLAVLFGLTRLTEISTLAQSVCSMLGLAMGIDYALLMVHRFRQALSRGLSRDDALAETMGTAGTAIALSGLTVGIGFAGLLLTRVLDTRSMGLGGLVVAASAVLLALTLLPALLAILGPRVDAPRWLRLPTPASRPAVWAGLARRVMARPVLAAGASLAVLLALAAPALTLQTGFPLGRWLPAGLEYQRGFDSLVAMGRGGLAAPVNVVLTAEDHALSARHVPSLLSYTRRLKADPRVESVLSPVEPVPGMSPLAAVALYADPEAAIRRYPLIGEVFASRDRHSTFVQVYLKDTVGFEESKAFSAEIANAPPPGYRVTVGGQAAFYLDFDRVMGEAVPWVVGFVMLATLAAMAMAFRSILVPIKAVAMNLLSVGAGLGVVVLVFQHGVGGGLFGLTHPLGQIPLTVTLSLFCIVFGLSMDYEVFLLSRIKERHDAGCDNETAVAEGLADTAGVITSAAAIMVCVFGAFAWAELVIVQMLGLGLAVAVAVDATLVRLLLVPALMRLAGDWNWYPGGGLRRT
jgi:RND superfamily putative drug exporter